MRATGAFAIALAMSATKAFAATSNIGLKHAAACVVHKNEAKALALVSAIPGSADENALIASEAPVLADCLGRGKATAMMPRYTILLGQIAELLHARQGTVRRVWQISPSDQDDQRLAEQLLERTKAWPSPVGTVTCAVERDLMAAENLIQTVPGSRAEQRAFTAFLPMIAPCLPAGDEMKVTPSQVRAIVARARLTNGFRDNQPSTGTAH